MCLTKSSSRRIHDSDNIGFGSSPNYRRQNVLSFADKKFAVWYFVRDDIFFGVFDSVLYHFQPKHLATILKFVLPNRSRLLLVRTMLDLLLKNLTGSFVPLKTRGRSFRCHSKYRGAQCLLSVLPSRSLLCTTPGHLTCSLERTLEEICETSCLTTFPLCISFR